MLATLRGVTDPTPTLTAAQAAEELTRLARTFAQAFHGFGASGLPDAGRSAAERLTGDRAARLLGEHAAAFAALVPESVLLAPARAAGERGVPELPDDLGAALGALDAAVAALTSRAGVVADGALRRVAAHVRADLALLLADLDGMRRGG